MIHRIVVQHSSWNEIYHVGQIIKDSKGMNDIGIISRIECVENDKLRLVRYVVWVSGNDTGMETQKKHFDNCSVSVSYYSNDSI